MESQPARDPWIVRSGRWLTKRRGILLAPLFTVALAAARWAEGPPLELAQDLAGLLCLFGGTRLRLVAASYHESSHRSEPITAGPYAWVRHPLYLSNFLLGLGIVLVAGWWPMVLFYILFYLPLHGVIARSEEVHLASFYGAKYEAYRRAVPAIFPWRRYPGPRYGSRSAFKLKSGKERLKAAGYLAGMAAILLVKQWRGSVRLPDPPSLAPAAWVLYPAVAFLAVVFRPKMRSSLLRSAQTVAAVVCVLALAAHLPGVLPVRAVSTAAIAPGPIQPVIPSPAVVARNPARQPKPAAFSGPVEPPPRSSFLRGVLSHVEFLGGATTFGVAALVEHGEAERRGGGFEMHEAGQAALITVLAVSVWKQLQAGSVPHLGEEPREDAWHFHVLPAVDENRLALRATWKRRF